MGHSTRTKRVNRREADEAYFEADELLAANSDERPACGLDIIVGWPLPIERRPYDDLAERISSLDQGVYVYPFEQTHITVLTAVNFKRALDLTHGRIRVVEDAAKNLSEFVEDLGRRINPFAISIGRPVLSSRAAFLPIVNPKGEIEAIRRAALAYCLGAGGLLSQAQAPTIIHSTILRFRRPPQNPVKFASRFREIGDGTALGSGTICAVVVALEIQPYMRRGTVMQVVPLD
jgi:hypothetical protein